MKVRARTVVKSTIIKVVRGQMTANVRIDVGVSDGYHRRSLYVQS